MTQGTVKWFNADKGYGFITIADTEEEIFVHWTAINMNGYKQLNEGQAVQFTVTEGDKGRQATEVAPLS